MRYETPVFLSVFGLISVVLTPSAYGQRANYENVLVGERAPLMGGAFTALADDSSAALHNPAGLAQVRRRGLSLTASSYAYQRTRIPRFIEGPGERVDLDVDTVLVFPNATSYVVPLGGGPDVDHAIAASVFVTHFHDFEGVENLSLDESFVDIDSFLSREEQVYLAGPTYAIRLGRLYLGASVFLQYATTTERNSGTIAVTGEDGDDFVTSRLQSFERTSASVFGLTGVLGALYRPTDEVAIGLRVRLPTWSITGSAESFYSEAGSYVVQDPSGNLLDEALYQDVYRDVESEVHYRNPLSVALGAAWGQRGRFQISGDLKVHLPLDRYLLVDGPVVQADANRPGEIPGLEDQRFFDPSISDPGRRLVVNGSIGAHVPLFDQYAALLGAFTDFSSVPDPGYRELDQIDQFGLSLGARRVTEDGTLTVGVVGRYGTGRTAGIRFAEEVEETELDIERWSVTVLISGSAYLGDAEEPEADASGDEAP